MTLAVIPNQVPQHLAGRVAVGAKSALGDAMSTGGGGAEHPRISIKSSRFRIVTDGNEVVLSQTTIDVVIVGANPRIAKTFFEQAWTPNTEPAAPDCFSLDGVRPSTQSALPQNDVCATCRHNAWGSRLADNGQELKACSDSKRLAVVSADDPAGDVYLLVVTPAALRGLNAYRKELSLRGIPPEIVRTRLSFDTDASFPKLMFSFGGFVSAEAQVVVDGLIGSPAVMSVTGEDQIDYTTQPTRQVAPATLPTPIPVAAPPAPPPPPPPPPVAVQEGMPARGRGRPRKIDPVPVPRPAPTTAAPRGFSAATIAAADAAASAPGEFVGTTTIPVAPATPAQAAAPKGFGPALTAPVAPAAAPALAALAKSIEDLLLADDGETT